MFIYETMNLKATSIDLIMNDKSIIELGVKEGLIDKAGAWYSYGDDRIGQGKDNVRNFLKENPEITEELESKLRQSHGELN